MLSATPHLTVIHYFRDFCLGALEEFCSRPCRLCGAGVDLELRLRFVLDLPIFRGRCWGAESHHFTFLPLFVAPGKWFGYPTIEKALRFILLEHTPYRAFVAWEINREQVMMESTARIPGTSTIRRWWDELNEDQGGWLDQAISQARLMPTPEWPGLLPAYGPDGIPGESATSVPTISSPSLPVRRLLCLLFSLGEILTGQYPSTSSVLGVGLWFLEVQVRRRCLARTDLIGRLIPGSFPNLAVTPCLSILHAPKTSPP